MIGTLIVSHGNVAKAMIEATQHIIGRSDFVDFYCVGWEETIQEAESKVNQKIAELDMGDGVLLLTDMFGGTPTNVALSYSGDSKIEVITGVNLPMIMKAMTLSPDVSLYQAARQLKEQAQKAIYLTSELAGSST
ncbi:MAG: PTS sugar transporter subunit IIA [Acidobacteria bacterium]|nr:PTS sugar transporter subunit IIA [Acidobacteriota bacterium]